MKATWKVALSMLIAIGLLLLPIVYANETVPVKLYRDGEPISSADVGSIITLHSELETASEGDQIKFIREGSQIEFIADQGADDYTVNVSENENGTWVAETEVKVTQSGTIGVSAEVIRGEGSAAITSFSAYEKAEGLSITTNVSTALPGERVTATASLNPAGSTDYGLLREVEWLVRCDGAEIETDSSKGEVIGFDVPEQLEGKTIVISAELKNEESGETLSAQEEAVQVKGERLSAVIYPSTDAKGVLAEQDCGFASEILDGKERAGLDITDGATYTWTAQLDKEYINGKSRGETFSVFPEKAGELKVQLKVELANGTILESEPVVKTVTEGESPLQSVGIRMKALEGSDDIVVGDSVSFTKTLEPSYATNLDGASYKWTAKQGENTIAEFENPADFWFTPESAGTVQVQLAVTPEEGETITSEPVNFNVTYTGASDKSIKLLSSKISANRDTTNLKAGDQVVMNADVESEGEEGSVLYEWTATNDHDEVIAQSNELKDFTFTSQDAALVSVRFKAQVLDEGEEPLQEKAVENQKVDTANQQEQKMDIGTDSELNTELNNIAGPQNDPKTDNQAESTLSGSSGEKTSVAPAAPGQVEPARTAENAEAEKAGKTESSVQSDLSKADKMAQQEDPAQKPDSPTQDSDSKENIGDSSKTTEPEGPDYKTVTDVVSITFLPVRSEVVSENIIKEAPTSTGDASKDTQTTPGSSAAGKAIESSKETQKVVSTDTNKSDSPSSGTSTNNGTVTTSSVESTSQGSSGSASSIQTGGKSSTGNDSNTSKNASIPVTQPTVKAGNLKTAFTTLTSVTNPQTGNSLSAGELAVIISCTCLGTVVAIIKLRKKRRDKNKTNFYL